MTTPPTIEHETTASGGRYFVRLPSGAEAEMTYRHSTPGTIVIDHTYVPGEARGHGLAQKLVERGIADARQNNIKIVPLCSYVVAQFRRHPDWNDLLAE